MSTALALMPLSDVREMATVVAKSGIFPDVKTVESAMALMLLCQSEGLHPMQALRRYHLINGRPAMKADAMLAEYMSRGGKVEWKINDDKECLGIFTAPGVVSSTSVRWTIQDAHTAGVTGNPTWKKYPRQMLRARVISEAIRMTMPEVVVGIYSPEEVADLEYIPPPARIAAAPISPSTQSLSSPVLAPALKPSNDTSESHPAVDAAAKMFPGAKVVVAATETALEGIDRVKRLGKMFTLPRPDGLSWKRPQIVEYIVKHYGVSQLSAVTDLDSLETAVVELLADAPGSEA